MVVSIVENNYILLASLQQLKISNEKRYRVNEEDKRNERMKKRAKKWWKKKIEKKSIDEKLKNLAIERFYSALNFRRSLSRRSLQRPDLWSIVALSTLSPTLTSFRAEGASVMLRCTATCSNTRNMHRIVAPRLIGKFTAVLEMGHNTVNIMYY